MGSRACLLTSTLLTSTLLTSTLLTSILAALVAVPALGQGTVQDGDASFTYTAFTDACDETSDFVPGTVDGSIDVLYAHWWYLGVDGGAEVPLVAPASQDYTGAELTITFTDVQAVVGLDVTVEGTVVDGDVDDGAHYDERLTVANGTGATVTVNVFHYTDPEVGGTFTDDVATFADPGETTWFRIEDTVVLGEFEEYVGVDADRYEVAAFNAVCGGALADGLASDLANTGVPFGPGDFTAAVQWQDVVLAPGESRTFRTILGVDIPVDLPLFADGFESGDTSAWSSGP